MLVGQAQLMVRFELARHETRESVEAVIWLSATDPRQQFAGQRRGAAGSATDFDNGAVDVPGMHKHVKPGIGIVDAHRGRRGH